MYATEYRHESLHDVRLYWNSTERAFFIFVENIQNSMWKKYLSSKAPADLYPVEYKDNGLVHVKKNRLKKPMV